MVEVDEWRRPEFFDTLSYTKEKRESAGSSQSGRTSCITSNNSMQDDLPSHHIVEDFERFDLYNASVMTGKDKCASVGLVRAVSKNYF